MGIVAAISSSTIRLGRISPPDIWWLKATLLSSVVCKYTGLVGKMCCFNHF